jgi:hypothetical protein
MRLVIWSTGFSSDTPEAKHELDERQTRLALWGLGLNVDPVTLYF